MRSKTSYFSKTIYMKNLTHYWPIWAVYLIICLYRLPVQLYLNLTQAYIGTSMDSTTFQNQQLILTVMSTLHPFLIFLFALITAAAVFFYLYTAKNANMLHALPVCRESLFISNCLSGLTCLILPQLISFLGAIFVCFAKQMTHLEYLLYWLVITISMTFFAFAFAVFTAMITGHIIAFPILYLIFNYLYVGVHLLVSCILCVVLYGFSQVSLSPDASFLSPLFYLSIQFSQNPRNRSIQMFVDTLKGSMGITGLYALAGAALLALSLLLYQKRQLETASDVIAVPFLKPLLRWIAAFCGAAGISVFGLSFFSTSLELSGKASFPLLVFMLLAGALIFFLAEMLICKEIRVFTKKRLIECGIYSALILVFTLCLGVDALGLESKMPAKDSIESIYIYGCYPINVEERDFDSVLALHEKIIDSKKDYEDYFRRYGDNPTNSSVKIKYTLKNGSNMIRNYYLPAEEYYLDQKDSAINHLMSLLDSPDYYLRYHFTENYGSLTFVDGTIDFIVNNGIFESTTLTQEQCNRIFEAFCKDIEDGNYQVYDYSLYNKYSDSIYSNTLFFTYTVPEGTTYVDYDGTHQITSPKALQNTAINLTVDCIHTIEALEKLGLLTEQRKLLTQKEYEKLYSNVYEEMNFLD